MRQWMLVLFLAVSVVSLAGCAGRMGRYGAPVSPPPGFLYEANWGPLDVNYHNTDVSSAKVGRSTSLFLSIPFTYGLLSFAWKDEASVANSMRAGNLTQVDYADFEFMNILGIFEEFTVVTHGK